MAQGAGGAVLDEPPPTSRRDRRQQAGQDKRGSRRRRRGGSGRGAPAPEVESADDAAAGARQDRRLAAERRRFWFVMMPTVAVLLALTVLVGALIRTDDDSSGSAAADGSGAKGGAPKTLLMAHRGADGRVNLLVLMGTGRSGASVLLFPPSTQVEVPSLGPQALADLPNEGDTSLLRTTIENLLGVKVMKTVMLDDASLAAVLDAAQPLDVDLNHAVQLDAATGDIVASGPQRATAEQATRLLVTPQPGSELSQLVTVQDVLDGWIRRLRRGAIAGATLRAQPDLAALVATAEAGSHRTNTLPVESMTSGGGERFEPRPADISRYVKAAFPNALIAAGNARPRVEILNGTGAVGLAQTIAGRVVPAGGQVTLTGNVPNFGVGNTQVVYYRDSGRAGAQRLLKALGCGSLKKAQTAIGVVDVTILAGADCFRTGDEPGQ